MKISRYFAALGLLAAFASTAFADTTNANTDQIPYTYITGSYQYDAVNNANIQNLHGFSVDGSVALGSSPFYAVGSVGRLAESNQIGGVDTYALGVGAHVPLNSFFDVYGQASVEHVAVGYPSDFRNYGYAFQGGLRYAAFDNVFVKAGLQEEKSDAHVGNWDTYGVAEVQYNVWNNVSVVGDAKIGGTDRILSGGVRLSF